MVKNHLSYFSWIIKNLLIKLGLGVVAFTIVFLFQKEVSAQNRKTLNKKSPSVTQKVTTAPRKTPQVSRTSSMEPLRQPSTSSGATPTEPRRDLATQQVPPMQRAIRAVARVDLLHLASGRLETRGQGFFISPQLFVTHIKNLEPMIIEDRAYSLSLRGQGFSYPATPEAFNLPLGIAILRTQFSHTHQLKLGSSNQEDHFYPALTLTLDDKLRGVLTSQARSPNSFGAPRVYSDFTFGGLESLDFSRGMDISPGLLNRYLSAYLQLADRQIASVTPWVPTLEKAVLDRQNEIVDEATREPLTLIQPKSSGFAKSMTSYNCKENSPGTNLILDCSLNSSLYQGMSLGLGEIRIQNFKQSRANLSATDTQSSWQRFYNSSCQNFRVHEAGNSLDIQVCTSALPSSRRLKFVEMTTRFLDQDLVIQLNGFERSAIQKLIRYFTQALGRAA